MKILFVSSECAPFSKSGGLADVAFSLPPALWRSGDEPAIVTPLYRCVRDRFEDRLTYITSAVVELGSRQFDAGLYRGERDGVPVWFIDNPEFFDRPKLYGYDDDALRFAFFSKAVLTLLNKFGPKPDIIHCNDWETALVVIYLKDEQARNADLRTIKSVYTIHNIAYQGQFGADKLQDTFALDSGWYDGGLGYEYQGRHDINLMKGAMLMADAVSTVSPNYARELHSWQFAYGLQGVVDLVDAKLYGILNGIDMNQYDPALVPNLPANFSVDDMSGKAVCKQEIQRAFGLREEPRWPLLASVARLVEQKGIELIKQILPKLMTKGVQLIVFGQGDPQYVEYFNWAKRQWPGRVGFSSDYSEEMASKVFAGADFYLMPSRFEPCGLSQMMAMRFGTIPIVHETGGLKDSVRAYSDFDEQGDGFSFVQYAAQPLYLAIIEGVRMYFGKENMFHELRRRCMTKDFSWEKSAAQYNRMYEEICGCDVDEPISFEDAFRNLADIFIERTEKTQAEHPEYIPEYLVLQIAIHGRADGLFHVEFKDGGVSVVPWSHTDAGCTLESSYDTLLALLDKKLNLNVCFLNGQLKVHGNIPEGYAFLQIMGL